jgi:hypothetical protein
MHLIHLLSQNSESQYIIPRAQCQAQNLKKYGFREVLVQKQLRIFVAVLRLISIPKCEVLVQTNFLEILRALGIISKRTSNLVGQPDNGQTGSEAIRGEGIGKSKQSAIH